MNVTFVVVQESFLDNVIVLETLKIVKVYAEVKLNMMNVTNVEEEVFVKVFVIASVILLIVNTIVVELIS